MIRLLVAIGFCALLGAFGLPAYAAELYEDTATGQVFSRPGDGRVPMSIPDERVGGLYEDESGVVYSKPGPGRKAIGSSARAEAGQARPEAGPAVEDYSSQAFVEAVRHVVSDGESATYPRLKLGAEGYIGYSYDLDREDVNSDKSNKNKFSLNRGYINIKGDLTPKVSFRITPDISRVSDTKYVTEVKANKDVLGNISSISTKSASAPNAGDYALRLKYYYIDFHDFLEAYPSLHVKLGQFEGAWLDHLEHLWTYRVQGTMLVEREGFMNSANLGVTMLGKLPSGYGEWQAVVANGEGYHADEANKHKSIQARLTLYPLPNNDLLKGLEFDGFTYFGRKDKRTSRDIYTAFVGYKYANDLFVGAEYLWTHGTDKIIDHPGANNVDGGGYSVMGWYRMPFLKPLRLMARWDRYDHNLDTPDNTVNRYIGGMSYDINKYVTMLADYERTVGKAYRGGYTSSTSVKDQSLLKCDVLIKF